ncbi:SDR family NAD(P)-dependent oxidoreductase [Pseudonocardia lacus]|uniref:SDR family NAD(P)-dependent oxidoreductase n=1 Tax=Pseudonocardia lacus TaxID=2835865 RepID=UPI001BDD54B4|nr:SDR family oxidoreductase [Pseudonocardia lacus]
MGVLDSRAVVVTGGGYGLGRAYALAAAAEGASVLVNDVDGDRAAAVVQEIADRGGKAVAEQASVVDPAAAAGIVEACVDAFGQIDGLVNNAGVITSGDPWTVGADDIRHLVDVNVVGVLNTGVAAIAAMRGRGGVIVNVTSGSHLGMPGLALYGATKGAVASLTYGWAIDLAGSGIRVVGFSPLGRSGMGRSDALPPAEDVAPAVAYLLSEAAAPLHGQVVRFDGRALSLLSPPAYAEPVVARGPGWTVADVADAVDSTLRATTHPIGHPPVRPVA